MYKRNELEGGSVEFFLMLGDDSLKVQRQGLQIKFTPKKQRSDECNVNTAPQKAPSQV